MALNKGKSIPLQEDIDPDYEPSAEGRTVWFVRTTQQTDTSYFVGCRNR